MLYTSYFARVKNHPRIVSGELRPMSIALSAPSGWLENNICFALRPWPFMVDQYKAGSLTEIGYEIRYRECVLKNISPEFILDYYKNCVLCCWESPEKWCHRRIVRKWIEETTWITIPELDEDGQKDSVQKIVEKKKDVEPIQTSLF